MFFGMSPKSSTGETEMIYLFALMPAFSRQFLDTIVRPQAERLLQADFFTGKLVIFSGLAGEEAVYPNADEGFTGQRPRDLRENDTHRREVRMVVMPSQFIDEQTGCPNPPIKFPAIGNIARGAETQTEAWANRIFGDRFGRVIVTRTNSSDVPLECCALDYMSKARHLGATAAIHWPVYTGRHIEMGELKEHLRFIAATGCQKTTLGESLPTIATA